MGNKKEKLVDPVDMKYDATFSCRHATVNRVLWALAFVPWHTGPLEVLIHVDHFYKDVEQSSVEAKEPKTQRVVPQIQHLVPPPVTSFEFVLDSGKRSTKPHKFEVFTSINRSMPENRFLSANLPDHLKFRGGVVVIFRVDDNTRYHHIPFEETNNICQALVFGGNPKGYANPPRKVDRRTQTGNPVTVQGQFPSHVALTGLTKKRTDANEDDSS
ncbi:hypothetical protein FRB99_008250 [Tulasnella sp. 403]|nr:hypothetical protein FRB99_008250 [Tulasnella sp. 403]